VTKLRGQDVISLLLANHASLMASLLSLSSSSCVQVGKNKLFTSNGTVMHWPHDQDARYRQPSLFRM
jgi:hypothetical protein